ncbi:MAG: hypothetical protein GF353_04395 [Candidatus Lokiarchaeota archaeon]|nr:hypothetical protein [Candidatus Lokiarchaeota archaeon]
MMNKNENYQFQKFGERVFIIAILLILSIFLDFLRVIALIIVFFALSNIKKINRELDDKNLAKFHKKMIRSFIVSFIGGIIVSVAFGVAAFLWYVDASVIMYLIPINILIYGIVLLFISVALQKKAWNKFHKFFETNSSMFPENILIDVLDGTDKLEKACKYTLFVITIPIALIYFLIGLFKLARLRMLPLYKDEEDHAPPKTQITPPISPRDEPNVAAFYCPSCGNKITRPARYCALCGHDLILDQAKV